MTDPLAKYKSKREFDETPEPEGKKEKGGNRHRFVIQLHHAKKARDHYDLRLENDDGTLSSWSIPKHKLPKGKEKLLAIKTEDHPVEYLKFKGEIAAGYGAGTVEIHDSGTYEEIEASRTKIVFRLKGKKEKGIYKLFRAGDGNKWMIMANEEKKASDLLPLSKIAAHSGAMLALMAPPAIAKKMRKAKMVDDKELADVLHMTLLYLGKAADLDDKTLAAIKRAVERVCARHMPLEMSVSGAGMFTPEKDGTPVYVVPNAKGLSALQADLEEAVSNIIELPSEHGWVPHMTVCYSCDDKPELPNLSEKLEWTADKVRLQVGDEKLADIPIGHKKRADGQFPLSKRAMDRLPIAADPAMWTDEQLMEAIGKPGLFGNDKEKFRLAIEQLAKRGLTKGIEPKDLGEWREHGWWLLMWAGIPLGFYDNQAKVDMAKRLLVEDFAKDGKQPIAAAKFDSVYNRFHWNIEQAVAEGIGMDPLNEEIPVFRGVGTAVDELVKHPLHTKRRKEFAEKTLNISKAPDDFTPPQRAVPTGSRPSEENSDAAEMSIIFPQSGAVKPEFTDSLVNSSEASNDASEKIVEDTNRRIIKQLKAEEAGLDPDMLSNDGFAFANISGIPFSKRAAMERLPIHLDPSMWKPEELMEVFRTPKLMEMLKNDKTMVERRGKKVSRFEAAVEELKKAGVTLADIFGRRDIGEWPEDGWFLLMSSWMPLGFIRGEAAAKAVLNRWIENAAKGNDPVLNQMEGVGYRATNMLKKMLESEGRFIDYKKLEKMISRPEIDLSGKANELFSHPLHEKKRRELAKGISDLIRMPMGFDPRPESEITGSVPTDATIQSAQEDIADHDEGLAEFSDHGIDLDDLGDAKNYVDKVRAHGKKADRAYDAAAKELADGAIKKLKWLLDRPDTEKTPSPEEMADDDLLSILEEENYQ